MHVRRKAGSLKPALPLAYRKVARNTTLDQHRPLVVANTKRHQQLAAHTPSPQPDDVEVAPEDDADIGGYLNTNAMATDGFYMPPLGEPASRGQQAGRPLSCTQRLQFGGSQETPEGDAGGPPPVIISPTTLHKVTGEQLGSADPVDKKKGRKHSRSKKGSASQPPPKKQVIRHQDGLREAPRDFTMHIAGQPILTPELLDAAGPPMVNLHHSIQHLETMLLKEKNPGYPVFTCKVPKGHGFVDAAPADLFFVRYEDVFDLMHSRRLDYNLVRLYALHMSLKVQREKTPGLAIVDPYYMRDVVLEDESDLAMVKDYLGNFFEENKTKDCILVPTFPE